MISREEELVGFGCQLSKSLRDVGEFSVREAPEHGHQAVSVDKRNSHGLELEALGEPKRCYFLLLTQVSMAPLLPHYRDKSFFLGRW